MIHRNVLNIKYTFTNVCVIFKLNLCKKSTTTIIYAYLNMRIIFNIETTL